MKVLFDTDVTLDLLLDRKPFSQYAAVLFSKAERGEIEGYLSATTVTTIYYLASKTIGPRKAESAVKKFLSFMKIAAVDQNVIESALEAKGRDFEDRVIAGAASAIEAKGIITRNIKDYKRSQIRAYLPGEFIRILQAWQAEK